MISRPSPSCTAPQQAEPPLYEVFAQAIELLERVNAELNDKARPVLKPWPRACEQKKDGSPNAPFRDLGTRLHFAIADLRSTIEMIDL